MSKPCRPAFLAALPILFVLAAPRLHAAPGTTGDARVPPAVEAAEKEATSWLLRQMVPNDVVFAPDPGRRRLLVSYRVPREDPAYRFVYGRSFVYDDALAAIAFTMLGRNREAEFILNALRHLVRSDGSVWFAYNTQNDWPGEKDTGGAIVRTGSVAWVGYAFTYYLGARARENSTFAATDPLAAEYLRASRSIASFLLANQVADPADPRFGLITGGQGASTIALDSSSRPEEVYDSARVQWVSMEHNLDAWFFLRDLARLAPEPVLAAAADRLKARLDSLWSEKDGQFMQGIHDDRTTDSSLPLDGASWGALFLQAQGRTDQAGRCVAAMQQRFRSRQDGVDGYRPYGAEPVYTDQSVNRFFFPEAPGTRWEDLPFIWGEGSLGAAAALIRTGNREDGGKVLDSLRALVVDGGLRYASAAVRYQFTDYPSVASTSWYIIAAELLRGGPAAASFWGP